MNPFKKIARLENRVVKLEKENEELRSVNIELKKLENEMEVKIKAATEKEQEYCKLITDLRKTQFELKKLIGIVKETKSKMGNTYKKAVKNIKSDFK